MNAPHKTGLEMALEAARKMPPLRHYLPGRTFDIMKSPAVDWLCQQAAVRQHIWNLMKPALVLDVESGKWRGVETQNDE